jgi:hypothetical protein
MDDCYALGQMRLYCPRGKCADSPLEYQIVLDGGCKERVNLAVDHALADDLPGIVD